MSESQFSSFDLEIQSDEMAPEYEPTQEEMAEMAESTDEDLNWLFIIA